MEKEVTLPDGVEAKFENGILVLKGQKGELSRKFLHPKARMELKGKKVTIKSLEDRRRANAITGTWASHIRNMSAGVASGWEARMKAVHSHFPIKMNVEGNKVVIQNFLGGRKPKVAKLPAGVNAEVKKDEMIITGLDKELVGQACGNIENVTRVTGRDKRVFQDGLYILGKPVAVEEKK